MNPVVVSCLLRAPVGFKWKPEDFHTSNLGQSFWLSHQVVIPASRDCKVRS